MARLLTHLLPCGNSVVTITAGERSVLTCLSCHRDFGRVQRSRVAKLKWKRIAKLASYKLCRWRHDNIAELEEPSAIAGLGPAGDEASSDYSWAVCWHSGKLIYSHGKTLTQIFRVIWTHWPVLNVIILFSLLCYCQYNYSLAIINVYPAYWRVMNIESPGACALLAGQRSRASVRLC